MLIFLKFNSIKKGSRFEDLFYFTVFKKSCDLKKTSSLLAEKGGVFANSSRLLLILECAICAKCVKCVKCVFTKRHRLCYYQNKKERRRLDG